MNNDKLFHHDETIRLSVCIPAYGRPSEYALLLKSIRAQSMLPYEVLICEDGSPQRSLIRDITTSFANEMQGVGLSIRFVENPTNLGYDGNLRRLIELATGTHVFFIGNDDYILPHGLRITQEFLNRNAVLAASRSFARFDHNPLKPLGYSRQLSHDALLNRARCSAGTVLRVGGFFGGLVFDRKWAMSHATEHYDGSLYYQIYLLFVAYTEGSIGYIASPTVAARADNTPLFGSSKSERAHFTPGRYSAKARGKMWESILGIAKDIENQSNIPIYQAVRKELAGKMSFHLFEMFAGRPNTELSELRQELLRLDLYDHWMPKMLLCMNRLLGPVSIVPYRIARALLQR
jgi:glycosyltransferase involved in cell wall biosynthesis